MEKRKKTEREIEVVKEKIEGKTEGEGKERLENKIRGKVVPDDR